MSTPDPKIVREIAAKVANIVLHDSVHLDQWISAVIDSDFGNECSQVRAPLHAAVARRMATVTVSWPAEQQPADVATAEQQPFVVDADTPVGRIGVWLTAWKRYFGTLGLPFGADLIAGPPPSAEPRVSACDFDVVLEVLAVVLAERARSAAAEQQQDGAVEDVVAFLDAWEAAGLPDAVAHTASAPREGERPGIYRQELTVQMLRAVLAERTALAARVAELAAGQDMCTCNEPRKVCELRTELDRAHGQLNAATARAESATVLPERWRALIAERDAANERAEKFCGAFSDAGSLAYRRGKLLDAALTRQTELAKERDEARELARASLDILRNVSDEPMRELFEVDDMDELPAWFTGYGKPSDAVAPDAPQDGLSEPVERSETSGGHGEGSSNSRAGTAGLSEAEHKTTTCGYPACDYPEHQRNHTTEDGQHG